ncbi:MAG: hypothetical protein HOJ79_10050 [Nitrospina sp.]|jgi:hypothetical protein|nr:hypothetical protein [Nitrospina sp.]MBT5550807.1 hypothetical protein [Nitrospina sp.]
MSNVTNPTEVFFGEYIEQFLSENKAANFLANELSSSGVGLMPLIDHCTIRTLDVNTRSKDFLGLGFTEDQNLGVLEFDNWWAKVFRKPGYPSLFIDQAFAGERGQTSLIPEWVHVHGDRCFHHIAILVEDIEHAIHQMKAHKFEFVGEIVGARNTNLRQIFTKPEIKQDKAYTVLELIERHNGYQGFLPPQADGLMESSRI